ncbi:MULTISPECIES: phosphopantetheine-binding protein [Actinotignum]|uniref:phosphopantetheine-binding protein n=1 Tax=Actinotignum TaxID=1653174 RepID=UPI00254EBC2D|nr:MULTISPECIES: phosphopantetheine-binding protein [Actinotignum]MDK7271347.1 phosphopantetheine-binding protein [Actinotignum schaalii]MDY5143677.1 phosphopantetheine-binding protein [Actinotignum timonense]
MEVAQLMSLGADVLEREGYPDATESFELSHVDSVTRWAIAVTLEDASGVVVPDSEICAARTLGELVRLSCPGMDLSLAPSSLHDGAAAAHPASATTANAAAGPSPEQSDKTNVRDKPETPTETNRPDVPDAPDENVPLSAEDLRAALGL